MNESVAVTATDDSPLPPLVALRQFRFWQRSAHLLIGGTGSGKSSIIEESLLEPKRFFKFSDGNEDEQESESFPESFGPPVRETALYFFCGASLATRRRLEGKLDNSVFDQVHWLASTDEWHVLEEAFEESRRWERSKRNPGQRRHVVIVDDFVVQNEEDRRRIIRLLTHNKRHQCCCVVLLTHQFVGSNSSHPVADNCERVYFTRTERNATNLQAFARRREVPREAFLEAARSLEVAPEDRARAEENRRNRLFDFACYDFEQSCFITDFRSFESGGVSSVIGKEKVADGNRSLRTG
jgi:hypothetical protein